MPNQTVLDAWKELKEKLITTLQNLKVNRFTILTTPEITKLQRQFETKRAQQSQLEHRRNNALLSQSDKIKRQQLIQEVQDIQRKLSFQQKITALDYQDKVNLTYNLVQVKQQNEYNFQQLKEYQERHSRLEDKLNWLRTLVRAGDINQLQKLVRGAKI